jgi:AcrR family transcriptional regulator
MSGGNGMADRRSGRGSRRKSDGAELIAEAARRAFVERGYHGVSVRELAQRANISLSTLYWFYPSKQDLLFALLQAGSHRYRAMYLTALEEAGDDPASQLDALVGATVEYAARYALESTLLSLELRNVEPKLRAQLCEPQEAAARRLASIVATGIETGVFSEPYPDDARRAIFSMCGTVARWYNPAGPLTIPQLISHCRHLARTLLGCPIGAVEDQRDSAKRT